MGTLSGKRVCPHNNIIIESAKCQLPSAGCIGTYDVLRRTYELIIIAANLMTSSFNDNQHIICLSLNSAST